MALIDVALKCAARGWHVFPCWPKTKKPMTAHGWKDATTDESTIRSWWEAKPEANVAIACNPSGLCVLDIDHGLADDGSSLDEWCISLPDSGFPPTYAVRTGRRPEMGVQLYFEGAIPDVGLWKHNGCEGQIKSLGGYVMAAGSIHPDSGLAYEVIADEALQPTPDWIRAIKPEKAVADDGEPITANRNVALTSIAGKLRNAGLSAAALEVALLQVNADRCVPPLGSEEVAKIAEHAANWALPEVAPAVVIGKPEEPTAPVDWRERYMTETAYLNVKPPVFLIDGFLVKKSIAMLAGPVAQRKSIIALNIAHALCTGDPLFGYFNVTGGHERVVYLCPEMGASSFVKRIKQIGLSEYVGKSLFIQTMSEAHTPLDDLDGELPGAVVIVDTITRLIDGDENKSEDMRKFAQKVFRLMNAGATVILLHHSKKGSSGSLDDGLRGSSELAAFVDSCWVTELEDTKKPYESLSKMRNVKQRDFESDPFKLKPAVGSYYLSMEGEPEPEAVLKGKAEDAAHEALRQLLAANPKLGINKICSALRAGGNGRGPDWVKAARAAILGGVTITEQPMHHAPFP